MKFVLNTTVFRQICRILEGSRNKFAIRLLLLGRRSGERVIITSVRREQTTAGRMSAARVVGLMFFHPHRKVLVHLDDDCRLTSSERQEIKNRLRENDELAVVVTVIERGGDLTFYPAYFSRGNPRGADMALEDEGSIICQQYSALGGCCRAPHETKIKSHNLHRRVPVNIHGCWTPVDHKIARLVRLVNQIPGITSIMSCQGGKAEAGNSRWRSAGQAYLDLASVRYESQYGFFMLAHLNNLVRLPDPRLMEITLRLAHKFEQRLGKPIAATRAKDALAAWERRGVPKMYPKLRLGSLLTSFSWDPRDTPKLLAGVEDLLREEAAQVRDPNRRG